VSNTLSRFTVWINEHVCFLPGLECGIMSMYIYPLPGLECGIMSLYTVSR
jgi:hypothetical protein